jgi:hypothetical protein
MQNPMNFFMGIVFAAFGIYSLLFPEKALQWLIKIQLFDWAKKSVSDLLNRYSMPAYSVFMIAIGAFMIYRALV